MCSLPLIYSREQNSVIGIETEMETQKNPSDIKLDYRQTRLPPQNSLINYSTCIQILKSSPSLPTVLSSRTKPNLNSFPTHGLNVLCPQIHVLKP